LDGIFQTHINYVIFLFIGGFFMALALEKWDLHKRLALRILSHLGGSPFKILCGFMLASAFIHVDV
jgi:sodium-dependent dicarboxylate transporter 2/3/5